MRAILVLVAASGCHGLWGIDDTKLVDAQYFDAPVDAPAQCVAGGTATGDFDLDGIVDECDLCPQNPAPTVDSDGDGIGDECDPRPTAKDTRVAFYAFRNASEIANWMTQSGSWSITPQGLVQSDATVTARIDVSDGPYGAVGVDTGLTVLSVASNPYAGTCANLTTFDFHCCNAEDLGPIDAITAQAATASMSSDFGGTVGAGHVLHLSNLSDTSHGTCTLSEGSSTATVTLMEDITSGAVALHTRGMSVAYHYLFIVKIGM